MSMTLLIKHLNLGKWWSGGEENTDKCREHSKKHKKASNAFELWCYKEVNQEHYHCWCHLESEVRAVPDTYPGEDEAHEGEAEADQHRDIEVRSRATGGRPL